MRRFQPRFHRPAVACFAALVWLFGCCASVRAGWPEQRRLLDVQYREQLDELAAKCITLELDDQAELTKSWYIERDPRRQYLFLVPEQAAASEQPAGLIGQWHAKWMEIRQAYAGRLFEIARQANDAGDAAAAYQLLYEVLREDPSHEAAVDVAAISFSGRQARPRAGRRTEPNWGWQRGQYWTVQSPHFSIRTNVSQEAAVSLAGELEDLHLVWRQIFFEHWSSPERLAARFAGRSEPLGRLPRHRVVLFRDRSEYLEKLRPAEPLIERSVGFYMPQRETAFFYGEEGDRRGTRLHEVTHQLFQESGAARADPGESWNFWVVEGVAVYMESLQKQDGFYTAGGFDADRLQFARQRRFSGEFFMEFPELFELGRLALQQRDATEQRQIYSQAAGLVHCLMDAEGGRYRSAFDRFLAGVYARHDQAASLLQHLDMSVQQLGEEYVKFLQVDDDDLRYLRSNVQRLLLERTRVTDRGLSALRPCQQLASLDLSHTGAGDAAVRAVQDCLRLWQLDLQDTAITNDALQAVSRLTQLKELDLSGTAIDDQGLKQLVGLPQLEYLGLARTAVTDVGLGYLGTMATRPQLDVSETRVTSAALRAFRGER